MTDWPRVPDPDDVPPAPPPWVMPRWLAVVLVSYGVLVAVVAAALFVTTVTARSADREQRERIAAQANATAQTAYNECVVRVESSKASAEAYSRLLDRARPDLDPAIRELLEAARAGAVRTSVIVCELPGPA